ncbi:MAG: hypothetical protein PHG82_01705 [Candidatus Gracilibacteria bacterium]|nr:hypothetical protein [Candidatus Gracilibacteria bacterium]
MDLDIKGQIISSGKDKIEIITDDFLERITLILRDSITYEGINDSFLIAKKTIIKNNITQKENIHNFNRLFILTKIEEKKQKCDIIYSDADLLEMYDFSYLTDIEKELEILEDMLLNKNNKLQIKSLIRPFKQINKYITNIGCFVDVNLIFSILIIHLEQSGDFTQQQKEYIFNLLNFFIIDFRNNLHILLTDFLGLYNPNYSTNIEYLKESHHEGENTVDLLIQKNSKLMEGFFFQMINDLDNIINPPEEYAEGEMEFF